METVERCSYCGSTEAQGCKTGCLKYRFEWRADPDMVSGKKKKRGRPRHGRYLNTGTAYYLCVTDSTKQMVHDLAGDQSEEEYLNSVLAPLWEEYLKNNPPPYPTTAPIP